MYVSNEDRSNAHQTSFFYELENHYVHMHMDRNAKEKERKRETNTLLSTSVSITSKLSGNHKIPRPVPRLSSYQRVFNLFRAPSWIPKKIKNKKRSKNIKKKEKNEKEKSRTIGD